MRIKEEAYRLNKNLYCLVKAFCEEYNAADSEDYAYCNGELGEHLNIYAYDFKTLSNECILDYIEVPYWEEDDIAEWR